MSKELEALKESKIMREIKFRGKYNKKWVYGSLVKNDELAWIIVFDESKKVIFYKHEVTPETVGQFTGLYDKNGKEIYEGDIVELIDSNKKILKCNVEYIIGSYWYVIQNNQLTIGVWEYHNYINKSVEVIGNIHESVLEKVKD